MNGSSPASVGCRAERTADRRAARSRGGAGALERLAREWVEAGGDGHGLSARFDEGVCACHALAEFPYVRFVAWSPRMQELTGYRMEEMNRLGWYQTVYPDPDVQARAMRRMEAMRGDDDLHEEEWTIRHRDGRDRILAISTRRIEESQPVVVLAHMEDRTELRQAEQRLLDLRLELQAMMRTRTVGEMAASLAHELNQPLAAMTANSAAALAMVQTLSGEVGPLREALAAIVRDAERASAMIARQHAFLRRDEVELVWTTLHVSDLAREVLALMGPVLAVNAVQAKSDFDRRCVAVRGGKVELQQVILNLAMNAVEAMEETEGVRRLRIRTRFNEELRRMELTVSDSGPGFLVGQEEALRPFYTMKRDGLGLGLPICQRIVEEHGGQLWIGRGEYGGAEAGFWLPVAGDGGRAAS